MRRLLPARLRWWCARRWVVRAEAAELMHGITEDPVMRRAYARNSMEHHLRAMRWWPLEHAGQVPPPDADGAPQEGAP